MEKIDYKNLSEEHYAKARQVIHAVMQADVTAIATIAQNGMLNSNSNAKPITFDDQLATDLDSHFDVVFSTRLTEALKREMTELKDLSTKPRSEIAELQKEIDETQATFKSELNNIEQCPAELKNELKIEIRNAEQCYISLKDGLKDGLKDISLFFTASWWSRRLALELIAAQWGQPLNMRRVAQIYSFCYYCPIIGQAETSAGKKVSIGLRPKKIKRQATTQTTKSPFEFPIYELHADGEPCVECAGTPEPLYYHHNVRIPRRLGETPASDWKPEWIGTEENAEVRTILLETIGIDRVAHMGTIIDSYHKYDSEWYARSEYELLDMAALFEEIDYAPYLKMKNQTSGAIHLEGVSPECKTIEEALQFRTGIDFKNACIRSIH